MPKKKFLFMASSELIDQFISTYITKRIDREDLYKLKVKVNVVTNTLLYDQINNLQDFNKLFCNHKIAGALKCASWNSPEFRSLPKRFIFWIRKQNIQHYIGIE